MPTPARLSQLLLSTALGMSAGACSERGLGPSDPAATDLPPPQALVSGSDFDGSHPLLAFGLPHVPAGEAKLDLTPSGGLLVSGLTESGADGVLTRLPDVSWIRVSLTGNQPAGFGRLGSGESFRITLGGTGGWRQSCAVRGAADGTMGVGCQNDAALGWVVQAIKDGQVVRSARFRGSRFTMTVPGFVLSDFEWDGAGSGALTLEEIEEGLVLKGVIAIPISSFPSTATGGTEAASAVGLATIMATPRPDRAYGYSNISFAAAGSTSP
ncbi:MAG: hypothetical protein AB7R55_16335 [Gemmatimonadales bacterium]